MIDLPLTHKTVVTSELERWLAAEESTHQPLQ